jgi:acetyl-CoA C-acetyltransferase
MLKNVFIAGTKRTPWGGFCGSLSTLSAPQLGSEAIKGTVEKAGIKPTDIDEVMIGNVLSAGCGQNIARQASLGAGIPKEIPCQTINKVCGSSLQTVVTACQAIQCGDVDVVVAGGAESMSNAPYLMYKARTGFRMGNGEIVDAMIQDGLSDAASGNHMGICGEMCAKEYNFTREKQDAYAMESYKRAQKAQADGILAEMIFPVEIKSRKGSVTVAEDEDVAKFNAEKFVQLRPAFNKEGTITAGNASNIDDGAASMIVCSEDKAKALNLPVEARILGYAVASTDPEWFTRAPAMALRKLSEKLDLKLADIDIFELNEAFAVVPMLAMQELNIPHEKVNIYGGAIALGHPIGASGARIIGTGVTALHKTGGKIGVASACNGGGEAWVIAFEKV